MRPYPHPLSEGGCVKKRSPAAAQPRRGCLCITPSFSWRCEDEGAADNPVGVPRKSGGKKHTRHVGNPYRVERRRHRPPDKSGGYARATPTGLKSRRICRLAPSLCTGNPHGVKSDKLSLFHAASFGEGPRVRSLKSNPVTEQNISGLRRWGNRCRYIPDAKASGYQDCIRSG
ncbi:MAG: hypothetical protein LBL94_09760, partial [Prevotellaceae bacterium]|nr:hypothetical protein [Prevotellaceae bacterium]